MFLGSDVPVIFYVDAEKLFTPADRHLTGNGVMVELPWLKSAGAGNTRFLLFTADNVDYSVINVTVGDAKRTKILLPLPRNPPVDEILVTGNSPFSASC